MTKKSEALVERLRAFAFALPGAFEDHPWGESVAKVGKKVFVFFGHGDVPKEEFGFCVKLPDSGLEAKLLPFVEPSTYGLGKHGWVMVAIGAQQAGMEATFRQWILESYRAVAPKKLVSALEASSEVEADAASSKRAPSRLPRTAGAPSRSAGAKKQVAKAPLARPASGRQRGSR